MRTFAALIVAARIVSAVATVAAPICPMLTIKQKERSRKTTRRC